MRKKGLARQDERGEKDEDTKIIFLIHSVRLWK